MKNVKPCPYCGGEVEVVKLIKTAQEKKDNKPQPYRIECRHCHALVARGQGFPIESLTEMEERIRDYNNYIANKFAPVGFGHKQIGGAPKYDS